MPIDDLIKVILILDIWQIAKLLVLAALAFYIVFTFLVIKEVSLMNRTLKSVFNLPIKIISWLHFGFAILVFILALIVL